MVANGITAYLILSERREILVEETTMYSFVIDVLPERFRAQLTPELIDEVFESVSVAYSS